jgi:23S rRNA (adenine2503-C2)-methyltransferase
MGMGEPLANYDSVIRSIKILSDPNGMAYSHRRITLSTVGLVPQLHRLGSDSPVNLAISLHSADNTLRSMLMPVNRKYDLPSLMQACREYPLAPRKRITFEYILLDGINDSKEHARSLIKLLKGIRAKVNLIPFNPHSGCEFKRPCEERILAFQDELVKAQMTVLIRQSRGTEISAACGQLAAHTAAVS